MVACIRIAGAAVFLAVAVTLPTSGQTIAAAPDRAGPSSVLLDRPARLVVADVALDAALIRLTETSGVVVAFSPSLLRGQIRDVSCDCATESVGGALDRLLAGTSFGHSVIDGQVVLTPEPALPAETEAAGQAARYASSGNGAADHRWEGLSALLAPARQGTITGRVVSAETGEGIGAVTVSLVGAGIGTLTEDDGRYRLERVPPGSYRVVAGTIGYRRQTKTVVVEAERVSTVDFTLEPEPIGLEELVVTATGEQRRVEVGNAVATIEADAITRTSPVTSVATLLTARAPGLQVLNASGNVGAGARIRIRGVNSLSLSNDPIVFVDGVRVQGGPSSAPAGGGIYAPSPSTRLNDLNPEEIESIDVLKGPSAAALYGTDAANGVILITTKRGRAGPPRWNVFMERGLITQPADFPSAYHSWGRRTGSGEPTHCLLAGIAAGACAQDSLTHLGLLEDPRTTPFGTGSRETYGVQLSGGAPSVRYFLSSEYENALGTVQMPAAEIERLRAERGQPIPSAHLEPNRLQKVNLRANLNTTLSTTADLAASVGYVKSRTRHPVADGSVIFGLMRNALHGPGYEDANGGWWTFPGGDILSFEQFADVSRFTSGLDAKWRPTDWLATHARLGLDLTSHDNDFIQHRGQGPDFSDYREGRRLSGRRNTFDYTVDVGGTGRFALSPRLGSETSIGVQYYRDVLREVIAVGSALTPGATTVDGGAIRDGTERTSESITLGGFVQQTFVLNDRLFLTGSVRTDNNSAFGKDLDAVYYPRASASWLVSGEPFFPDPSWLSSLRYRLAYGQSGVSPGPLDALKYYTAFAAVEDGAVVPGLQFEAIGNSDLRPERTAELETGIDVGLLDGRANLEITYYDKRSKDALVARPLPLSLGVVSDSRFENLGSVRNRGWEALLDLRLVDGERFAWDVTLGGSVNDNELEALGEGIPPVEFVFPKTRAVPGSPLFGRWDRPILGYSDANGDGIIAESEMQVGDTAVFLGSSIPTRQASLRTAVTLFGGLLRIGAQLDHRGGHLQYNRTEADRCTRVGNCRAVNDPTAPLAEQARAVAARSAALGRTHAGYMEDGSFTKLREMSLTLSFPERFAAWAGARTATLTLAGRNLGTWTDYSGIDPESSIGLFADEFHMDLNVVPQPRHWIIRLNLGL